MSRQRFMPYPGSITGALLFGAFLALLCLSPVAVFASTYGQAEERPFSPAMYSASPSSALLKTGVAVVRLVAAYGANSELDCTGLGVLVASDPPSANAKYYTNWVLADGNLVNQMLSKCGQQGGSVALNRLEIWGNTAYTGGKAELLGSLSCQVENKSCTDFTDKQAGGLPDKMFVDGSSQSVVLFSFQSEKGQPFVSLAKLSGASDTVINVGLVDSAKGAHIYPSKSIDRINQPVENFVTPIKINYNPPGSPTGTGKSGASVENSVIEGGTPQISEQGQVVGIWVSDNSTGSYGFLSEPQLLTSPFGHLPGLSTIPTLGPKCTTVATCWNVGIDAYTGGHFQVADTNLSAASALNRDFKAASYYGGLAHQQWLKGGGAGDASTSSSLLNELLAQWPLIAAGAAVLVVILLLLLVFVIRSRRRKRELARFEEEVATARRIAAEQVAQQQHAPPPVPPAPAPPLCPNCHQAVYLSDQVCPHCRFPLSPSASGLGVRLAGNVPVPVSPPPPSALMISEQPTVQMAPASPIPQTVGPNELAAKRGQFQNHDHTTQQNIRQLHGHNLSLAVGTRSDPGIKRKHKPNEDSLFALRWDRAQNSQLLQFGLFVVADGMGGHANGQDASRLAIQTMINFMLPLVTPGEEQGDEAFLRLMGDGVQASNQAVHARNMESHADMGTTMTSALVIGSKAYVANVGDSRTYLYRVGQGLSKVTRDHSVVASLVDAGIIKPDDIYTHPKRNQIYRSLGEKPVVEVDTFQVDLQAGDKLMLCSDGLWDMVRDPLIQDVLSKTSKDPDKTGQDLIKAALDGGGEDNVSVIVIQMGEMNDRVSLSGVQLLAKPETVVVPNLPTLK